jgi:GT2 family glycosyltransferase
MKLAPIAVFVYRRPAETRRVLESLLANPEAARSRIYVFADGSRGARDTADIEATRRVARSFAGGNVQLVERHANWGLARSVIAGVSQLCRDHGRAIVLEDDLTVSKPFLEYMNTSLDRYEQHVNVWHVSGYMYPVELRSSTDAVFLPFISSYGWATWERAWRHFDPSASGYARLRADPALRRRFDLGGAYRFFRMLKKQQAGQADSWAIRWYLSMFLAEALALVPTRSLVTIGGFSSHATHTSHVGIVPRLYRGEARDFSVHVFPEPRIDEPSLERLRRFFRAENWYRWPFYKAVNWVASLRERARRARGA